jgi:hypothetical protein
MAPTPNEPNPPLSLTAAAMAGDETPAIGAWMIGTRMSSRSSKGEEGKPGMARLLRQKGCAGDACDSTRLDARAESAARGNHPFAK